MRIRTIKPEFYRSEDIKRLSREHRLLFVGLWSYVDDNGVGVDDDRLIAADLFPLEDDPSEVRDYVREGLATLARGLQIVRYEVADKRFLFITTWDLHQRIDRPAKPRYPRPEGTPTRQSFVGDADSHDDSRLSRDSLDAGTGEQGNRGTGEPSLRSGPRKRGTRIPEDFAVTPEMVQWAKARVPLVNGRTETEKFINYWQSKSGREATKLDWVKTWRNWMLTAAERLPARSPGNGPSRPSTTDQRVMDAQALKALYEDSPLQLHPGGAA